jgi:hypothetical protein
MYEEEWTLKDELADAISNVVQDNIVFCDQECCEDIDYRERVTHICLLIADTVMRYAPNSISRPEKALTHTSTAPVTSAMTELIAHIQSLTPEQWAKERSKYIK